MRGIIIRQMIAADIPSLVKLERENFSDPWTALDFESEQTHSYGITLVAEDEGSPCGYLNAYHVCENVHINTFCVEKSHRRMGVASSLLNALFETVLSDGAEEVTLEVRAGNSPAIFLYEKFGFVPVGVRKRFYRKPEEDAVIMKKELRHG